jgi:protoheme IX farnesyltransferase
MSVWGEYYRLTKPGIVYGNLITVLAGYAYASRLEMSLQVLLALMSGMALVIATSCVINNVMDRDIDARMERTKNRPLVTGAISMRNALLFGSVLGVVGIAILIRYTNALTTGVALFGAVFYIVAYGYAKRHSPIGTLVGSVSGAVPIFTGYAASTGMFGISGLVLSIVLVLWQMPHFYSISIFRMHEYAEAGIPVTPLVSGVRMTKLLIVCYIPIFVFAEVVLTLIHRTGYTYAGIVILVGVAWFAYALQGFETEEHNAWAKQMFLFSLVALLSFCIAVSFGRILP